MTRIFACFRLQSRTWRREWRKIKIECEILKKGSAVHRLLSCYSALDDPDLPYQPRKIDWRQRIDRGLKLELLPRSNTGKSKMLQTGKRRQDLKQISGNDRNFLGGQAPMDRRQNRKSSFYKFSEHWNGWAHCIFLTVKKEVLSTIQWKALL